MNSSTPEHTRITPRRNETLACHAEKFGRVGSWHFNLSTGELMWSDGMYRMHGVAPGDEAFSTASFIGNVHADDLTIAARAIEGAVTQGQSGTLELRIALRDGGLRQVLAHVDAERGSDGTVTHIVGAVQDVTALKKARDEKSRLELKIQQAQKLESLGVLAGGIAHDFNNLLMGILGNADLALMDLSPESPARQSIVAIEKAAKRAADLARQMLAYSGKGKFIVKRLDLKVLIEEMMHLLKTSLSKKAVLRYELAPDIPPIEADAAQIRQVVMSLVINASEAIGDRSGVICVRTGAIDCDRAYLNEVYLDTDLEEGLYSYIEVSDTGIGMDRETLAKIFDPFFTTKFTGRGLGLAAVLGIVRGHRAAIKVYSEPKKGTIFKVLFFANTGPVSSTSPAPDYRLTSGLKGKRVLLVDDEETVRAVGKNMLERIGCRVVTAEDGRKAFVLIASDPVAIDCVILDLTMPHMDGEECYRELRRIRPDIKVILSSGYSEQDLIDRFAGKGLDGFIQKPYKTATLQDKLIEAFGLK